MLLNYFMSTTSPNSKNCFLNVLLKYFKNVANISYFPPTLLLLCKQSQIFVEVHYWSFYQQADISIK